MIYKTQVNLSHMQFNLRYLGGLLYRWAEDLMWKTSDKRFAIID